jgi:hypothetical protein
MPAIRLTIDRHRQQHDSTKRTESERMTKAWRVDVLECRGSSYDVGKQLAEGFLRTTRGRAYARQLGGIAKPFDPGRRVIAKSVGGAVKVFSGTPRDNALFKDLTLANASFANVSLAGARFDDIDFSNTVISSNCNFNGMQIAGVGVNELLAVYARHRPEERA